MEPKGNPGKALGEISLLELDVQCSYLYNLIYLMTEVTEEYVNKA